MTTEPAPRLAHRDLRNRSSEILREVSEGATFQITHHGEVVALLTPPGRRQLGLATRSRRVRGGLADLPRVRLDHPVQADLDEPRDES